VTVVVAFHILLVLWDIKDGQTDHVNMEIWMIYESVSVCKLSVWSLNGASSSNKSSLPSSLTCSV